MTPRQRLAVFIATALVAVTRWLALSRTLWDWDEAQFVLAIRNFDVAAHHPQPPGFPLFIAAAKLVHALGLNEFHALQAINFIAAVLIVPAMVMLANSLDLQTERGERASRPLEADGDLERARRPLPSRFFVAMTAALILAFFPNVWFYGGTGLSDVPSMTLVVFGVALLLRASVIPSVVEGPGRAGGAPPTPPGPSTTLGMMYCGAILLGLAAGIRPQNLLLGIAPFVLAAWRQRWRVIGPALVAALIVIASYGGAAIFSGGWHVFAEAARAHQAYIAQHDAFTSPTHPPLTHVIDDFFIRPYRAQLINLLTTVLVALALVRARRSTWIALATFGPFCVAAWLLLDRFSASRFAVGYAPLFAILAAEALRDVRYREVMAGAYIALMIVWTWPALRIVHTTVSPPVAAAEWLKAHAKGVMVDERMGPFGDALLPDMPRRELWHARRGDFLLADRAGTITFRRPHGHLWKLARQRYFEISATPIESPIRFGEGWYGEESSPDAVWRWMGRRSVIAVPPSTITVQLYVPHELLKSWPTITVHADGVVIDHFTPAGVESVKTWKLPKGTRELVIETDHVARTASDPRDLGLRLERLTW